MTQTTVLVDTLRFPESPRWYDNHLWCVDLFERRVVRIDMQGGMETVVKHQDILSAVGWTPYGQQLIVSAEQRKLLRNDYELVTLADLSALVRHPLNDMVIDARGGAYIGNMGYDFDDPNGTPQPGPIVYVSPEGEGRIAAEGLGFPNGMVITPDGQRLIVAESHAARISAFDVAADGSLSNWRIWAEFPEDETAASFGQAFTPDGICLDQEGAVWVASPTSREVIRVQEGGFVTHRIPMNTIPLACELGGWERRTLFIPSIGSFDSSAPAAVGRIEYLEVDVPGIG
ncbi:MAG: SMP-30/gluconolactonase/LRE family protein [Chloroflexi bacterium]|nr:SMP-30/gluconolactonase/LRE family protein [Chloroflexota bacterium]MCC6893204.1 SMP-30/gluconolactonase/LRE family protein [Anaerolineae bacterium]